MEFVEYKLKIQSILFGSILKLNVHNFSKEVNLIMKLSKFNC